MRILILCAIVVAVAGCVPRSEPGKPAIESERDYLGESGIRRHQDKELGVACYLAAGGSLSCVKVSP